MGWKKSSHISSHLTFYSRATAHKYCSRSNILAGTFFTSKLLAKTPQIPNNHVDTLFRSPIQTCGRLVTPITRCFMVPHIISLLQGHCLTLQLHYWASVAEQHGSYGASEVLFVSVFYQQKSHKITQGAIRLSRYRIVIYIPMKE